MFAINETFIILYLIGIANESALFSNISTKKMTNVNLLSLGLFAGESLVPNQYPVIVPIQPNIPIMKIPEILLLPL